MVSGGASGEGLTGREARVAAEIRRIAREDLGLEAAAPAGAPLASALDSLALLSLVVAVEDRFRVALSDEAAAGARSLEDLARLVAARAAPEAFP
ncbi:phosphopantetheine-binding protein [Anaeromyxobacter oryzisoli]|uniref:phosphopantetheine-binding protein n=1 Tax=Anaeromyxobacter oryzisoli TaxID=2925408 RepID=UPI001F55C880|nr:phosphopantetheine-binding protein [Anaeromyxobacter sp. SG63]